MTFVLQWSKLFDDFRSPFVIQGSRINCLLGLLLLGRMFQAHPLDCLKAVKRQVGIHVVQIIPIDSINGTLN